MLTNRKNINYLVSMDDCFLKASESYANLTNLPKEVLWISTISEKELLILKVTSEQRPLFYMRVVVHV